MTDNLGTLEKVSLRDFWQHEERDFTPWLSREENLTLLGDALDLDIELIDTEVNVGNYSADIVAQDINGERKILVENQLQETDHSHLGKLLAYSAGIGAEIVIWISESLREEHRKSIDWLNDHTDQEIAFFGLEIELWQINESPPAPKFNIVSSPNEWARLVQETTKGSQLSETKLKQREFWTNLRDFMEEQGTFLSLRKPQPRHWYSIAVGRSNFKISLTINTREQRLGCELYITHDQADRAFELIHDQQHKIEDEVGKELDWQGLPDADACRIATYRDAYLFDEDEWSEYFEWCKRNAESFHDVFSPRIQELDLS